MKKIIIHIMACLLGLNLTVTTAAAISVNLDAYTPDIETVLNSGQLGIRGKTYGPVRADLAGDITGDGRADLLVAYPGKSVNGTERAGAIYYVAGKKEPTIELSSDTLVVTGSTQQEFYGTVTQYVGDLNNDGKTDWFAADGTFALSPTLYLTNNEGFIDIALQSSLTEPSLLPMGQGDINGDGNDDLVLSDNTYSIIYIVPGPLADDFSGDIEVEATTTLSDDKSDLLYMPYGDEIDSMTRQRVGDVNNDGFDDILVYQDRAPWDNDKVDYLLLFLGAEQWPTTLTAADADMVINFHHEDHEDGDNDNYQKELRYAMLSDVNGDNKADIMVSLSEQLWVPRTERIFALRGFFGKKNLPKSIDILTAADIMFEDNKLGYGFTTGDIDGDDINDLLVVGHYNMTGPFYQYGKVYAFNGKRQWPNQIQADDASIVFRGGGVGFFSDDIFVDAGGDIDNDGKADIAIGTPMYRNATASRYYILTSRDHDSDGLGETEGDCNDADGSIYPGMVDTADGINNDCDSAEGEDTTYSLLNNGAVVSSKALSFHRTKVTFSDGSQRIIHAMRRWRSGKDLVAKISSDGIIAHVRQVGGQYNQRIELFLINAYTGETVAHQRISKSGRTPTGLSIVTMNGALYLVTTFTAVEYYGPGWDIGATVRSYQIDLTTNTVTFLSEAQNTMLDDHTYSLSDGNIITLTAKSQSKKSWQVQLTDSGELQELE